jgi:hypothetical protein
MRWIELIKNYDCTIKYYNRKANMVTNAFRCKNKVTLIKSPIQEEQSLTELGGLETRLNTNFKGVLIT